VENTIDLQISDTAGISINIFIESMPITSIYNLIDNSVNFTLSDAPSSQVAAVLEPTSLSLLMLGLGAVGLLRRGRRNRWHGGTKVFPYCYLVWFQ
jgi:hypothetical protein